MASPKQKTLRETSMITNAWRPSPPKVRPWKTFLHRFLHFVVAHRSAMIAQSWNSSIPGSEIVDRPAFARILAKSNPTLSILDAQMNFTILDWSAIVLYLAITLFL